MTTAAPMGAGGPGSRMRSPDCDAWSAPPAPTVARAGVRKIETVCLRRCPRAAAAGYRLRMHIRKALNHCEGSVGKSADALGISRKTLWEKMKRLAIKA